MVAVRVVVHGDVQGVFFRDSCRREAQSAAVAGWVRNGASGTVEALFEGRESGVKQLVEWCNAGPPQARVDRVDVSDEPESGLSGFEVRG